MSATLDDPRIGRGMRAQMELRKRRFNEGAQAGRLEGRASAHRPRRTT